MILQLAELTRLIAEMGETFARMGQVVIEAETPVIQPEPVDEFPEIEGVIRI